jgi:HEAT repeat protein
MKPRNRALSRRVALAPLVAALLWPLATSAAEPSGGPATKATGKASSKPPKKPRGSEADGLGLLSADIDARLASSDDAVRKLALEELRAAGPAASSKAPLLFELLGKGLSPDMAVAALDAASDIGVSPTDEAVAQYRHHTKATVREAACRALGQLGGPGAEDALLERLRDSEGAVRAQAARGLATRGTKRALSDLFLALEHGVGESSEAIGRLCDRASCDRFAAFLGKLPLPTLAAGLRPLLLRDGADPPEAFRITLITRLRELGTQEAAKFLQDTAKGMPRSLAPAVQSALKAAASARVANAGDGT